MRKQDDFIKGLTPAKTKAVSTTVMHIRNMASDSFDKMFHAEKDEISIDSIEKLVAKIKKEIAIIEGSLK